MGRISSYYHAMEADRAFALENARQVERVTVRVGIAEPNTLDRPYVGAGRRAAANLANLIVDSAFPAGVEYYRLSAGAGDADLPQRGRDQLLKLKRFADDWMDAADVANHNATIAKSILVAGCILVNDGVHPTTRQPASRIFPLSRFVLEWSQSRLRRVALMEDVPRDRLAAAESKPSDPKRLYTLVDYEQGAVIQEIDDTEVRVANSSPDQWYVPMGTEPEADGYPTPYLWYIEPDLWSIDAFRFGLHRLAELAEKIYGFSEEIDPQDIQRAKPGRIFRGRKESFGWSNAGTKLADAAILREMVTSLEGTVDEYALSGLEEQVRGTNTAFAASVIARLVDARLHGFHGVLSRSWLKARVLAALSNLGVQRVLGPVKLEPVILTGAAAFGEQEDYQSIREAIKDALELDPELVQRINTVELLRRRLARLRNAGGLILEAPTPETGDPNVGNLALHVGAEQPAVDQSQQPVPAG